MSEVIKSKDSKYTEYEDLLIERDGLEKEAGQIWTVYLQMFGQLIIDGYEEKIECIKCKKIIAYYQQALNRGGEIDSYMMDAYIEQEMAEYYANLRKMKKDHENAENAVSSSAYEVKRSKELYRRLAKLLHPDMNPATDRSEDLQEIWTRIQIAYRLNDVKALAELEVLARKVLKDLGLGDERVEIPDIEDKIDEVREEIADIRMSEPYTLKRFVEDEADAAAKKKELEEELESFRKYHKELNEVILRMLQGGGLKIYV